MTFGLAGERRHWGHQLENEIEGWSMKRRRYTAVVAGLAVALLAGMPGAAVATDKTPSRVDAKVEFGARTAEVAARFEAMAPVRVLDTRTGTGTGVIAPIGPAQSITIDLSALVPTTATSVVLNVTGTAPTGNTFVTVYPAGTARPLASNLNLVAGQTRANAVVVAVPADRRLSFYNNIGSTHVVADLAGIYTTTSTYGYTAISPVRALDTRVSGGALGPAAVRTVDLSGLVPANASAVTFNLTGVGATANTFITAWPTGVTRPLASSLNLGPNQTVPNQVTVALGTNRQISLYNNAGSTHLIVDVAGYYAESQGSSFYALSPERFLDTRFPPPDGLTPDEYLIMQFFGAPSTMTAVTFNLTGTNATAPMFVTSWPGLDASPEPLASNLNLVAGQTAPNLVTVAVNYYAPDDAFEFWTFNNNGYVDLIMDLAGYFA